MLHLGHIGVVIHPVSILERNAFNHVREVFKAPNSEPAFLGTFNQLEDQCQDGVLGDTASGLVGSEADGGEGGFNGIGSAKMRPMLSGEIEEGQQMSIALITLDAMGTQTAIAREIIGHGADYVLCLKSNHPTLWAEVTAWFEQAEAANFEGLEHRYDTRVESGHHRREYRRVWAVPVALLGALHPIEQWAGLKTIVLVRRVRHLWNKITRETMIYLTSLPCDAARIGRAIRTHWGIENQLHWVLDVTWEEDKSRIRRGHGGENMALLV